VGKGGHFSFDSDSLVSAFFCHLSSLAFLINVLALPFEYRLFDKNLKNHGIERSIQGKVF
jgi:hypothetical protein